MDRRDFLKTSGLVSGLAGVGAAGVVPVGAQQSSAPSQAWAETYSGGGTDTAATAVRGTDGGFLFAGQTTDNGVRDAWALKVDDEGQEQWRQTYGGGAEDWISAATATTDGYLLAGQTASSGNGQLDAWLLKIDTDGTEQWERPYGDTGDDRASSVLVDGGGYVFAGGTKSEGSGGVDAWLLRVDEQGDEQWNKVYGGSGTDWAFDHVGTDDGGYLLAGETDSAGAGGRDAWVLKADSDGAPEWNTVYGGGADDYVRAIEPAHDDGYVLAGGTKSSTDGGTDGWLLKIGPDGAQQWEGRFGGSEDDRLVSLIPQGSGYLAVGSTASSGRGAQSTWAVKVDAGGDEVWRTTYGTGDTDYANAVVGADGPLITGTTESGPESEARLVKLLADAVSVQPAFEYDPAQPGQGDSTTFDASASTAPSDATYEWDFDGDGRFEARGQETTKSFDDAGDYDVTLRITAGSDQRATTQTVTVAETVSLTPQSLEPVQVVDDTRVSSGQVSTDIPDPDMVAGRPTAVLFSVDARNTEALGDDDEVAVTVSQRHADDSTTETTGTLLGETVKRVARSDQPSMSIPVERAFQSAPVDRRPPVFTLAADVVSISVSLSSGGESGPRIGGETTQIDAGTGFSVAEMDPLTVGFIGFEAPTTTVEEKFQSMGLDLDGIDQSSRQDTVPAYGGTDGKILPADRTDSRAAFEGMVERCVDYLRRTYPVPSVEYETHPSYLKGQTASGFLPDLGTPDGLETDLRTAYDELHAEYPETDFDEVVAIVPNSYHLYHYRAAGGVHLGSSGAIEPAALSQPQTACTVESREDFDQVAAVAAQEVGHHFHGKFAYPDALSMRQRDGPDAPVDIDNSHARTEKRSDALNNVYDEPAVRSRAYDLWDGTFRLRREDGDSNSKYAPEHDQWTLGSYMSYSLQARWSDAYIYQQSIDDGLSPTPPVERLGWGSVPVLSGNGAVTDDGDIAVGATTRRQGSPTPTGESEQVTITVEDRDGNTLETQAVPASIDIQGHGAGNETLDGRFTFTAPFPEETTALSLTDEASGAQTTVNPIERTLTGAIRSVPADGFTGNADQQRTELLSTVETLNGEMGAEEYGSAGETIDSLRTDIQSAIRPEYDTAANEYSRAEILRLVEDMRSRLGTIAAGSDESGGLPSWAPIAGGAGLGVLGGSAALYRYLTGSDGSDDNGE